MQSVPSPADPEEYDWRDGSEYEHDEARDEIADVANLEPLVPRTLKWLPDEEFANTFGPRSTRSLAPSYTWIV